jgi:hypothetical protein
MYKLTTELSIGNVVSNLPAWKPGRAQVREVNSPYEAITLLLDDAAEANQKSSSFHGEGKAREALVYRIASQMFEDAAEAIGSENADRHGTYRAHFAAIPGQRDSGAVSFSWTLLPVSQERGKIKRIIASN